MLRTLHTEPHLATISTPPSPYSEPGFNTVTRVPPSSLAVQDLPDPDAPDGMQLYWAEGFSLCTNPQPERSSLYSYQIGIDAPVFWGMHQLLTIWEDRFHSYRPLPSPHVFRDWLRYRTVPLTVLNAVLVELEQLRTDSLVHTEPGVLDAVDLNLTTTLLSFPEQTIAQRIDSCLADPPDLQRWVRAARTLSKQVLDGELPQGYQLASSGAQFAFRTAIRANPVLHLAQQSRKPDGYCYWSHVGSLVIDTNTRLFDAPFAQAEFLLSFVLPFLPRDPNDALHLALLAIWLAHHPVLTQPAKVLRLLRCLIDSGPDEEQYLPPGYPLPFVPENQIDRVIRKLEVRNRAYESVRQLYNL